jgi:hypothetical protein
MSNIKMLENQVLEPRNLEVLELGSGKVTGKVLIVDHMG